MSDRKEKTRQEVKEEVGKYIPPVRKDWYKDYDLTDPDEVRRVLREILGEKVT